jgi:regulator of sigma E protease
MSLGFTTLLAFVFAIGVLVSVHEFGHYWVARRLGFKVLRFSIGFGKPILKRVSRHPDHIEYVLAAIPLGGYVRLLDEREGPLPAGEEHRAFNRRPPLARILVLLAGPCANFLFAIAAYWALFMYGIPGLRPVIGEVAEGSIASAANIRPDDELIRVAGRMTPTRQAAVLGILEEVTNGGRVLLTVRAPDGRERDLEIVVPAAEQRALTEPGALPYGLGLYFWRPALPVVVGSLTSGDPAALAGIAVGDRIVEMEGRPVNDFTEFVAAIRSRPGMSTQLAAIRDGNRLSFTLVPKLVVSDGKSIGQIGLGADVSAIPDYPESMRTVERHGVLAALVSAVQETWDKSALTMRFLWRMVTGHVSTKNISGPINIAQYAGLTAHEGFDYYLGFLALVSISLGVLNLLPIPVLDGGQVMYQLFEMARGNPLPMQAQVLGQKLGIAMLILLMGFAFYNDITRLLG